MQIWMYYVEVNGKIYPNDEIPKQRILFNGKLFILDRHKTQNYPVISIIDANTIEKMKILYINFFVMSL